MSAKTERRGRDRTWEMRSAGQPVNPGRFLVPDKQRSFGGILKLMAIYSVMRYYSRYLGRSSKPFFERRSPSCANSDLFEYTSGRFFVSRGDSLAKRAICLNKLTLAIIQRAGTNRFNEDPRRAERRIQFDVDALARAACYSVGRRLDGVASITKLAESGFNRVLQITFNDGYVILARLPYKTTVPKNYAVASEAATLVGFRSPKFLRILQIRQMPLEPNTFYLKDLKEHPWATGDSL
ncbi:hypothetical protein POX_e07048 [Penicillium oxalicum]|uniref:hypothetical protein n=1 Tax=Penicillium oxalicum TaxID=69781 RepID=UPI0020B8E61B|nr:hypothetical protein POX_e07048 [Penicillium oxalicum]KAI2789022.1 hypothetical protein POX_e07048 [Penicillium oxalicum]